MAWFKDLFSKKRNKQAKEVEKKAQTTAPEVNTAANSTKEAAFTKAAPSEEKERYTYFVGGVSTTEPWIFIICNEEDATWDSEPFTDLVKKAARIMNDGVWEGNILPAGIYQGDIITHINGKQVTTSNQLINEVTSHRYGTVVEITLQRIVNGFFKEFTFSVTLQQHPELLAAQATPAPTQAPENNRPVPPEDIFPR